MGSLPSWLAPEYARVCYSYYKFAPCLYCDVCGTFVVKRLEGSLI